MGALVEGRSSELGLPRVKKPKSKAQRRIRFGTRMRHGTIACTETCFSLKRMEDGRM
ncbi:hypothetical protein CGLAMM_02550 [Acetobacteraceae bacterium EV16G]|uniref:Uncharacterized protein n=1 Tax=Sorlinia euscelidii TaxID=3081148 RepID=A0ABU7U112_9PROT